MLPELPIAGHLPFEEFLLFPVTPPPAQFLKNKTHFLYYGAALHQKSTADLEKPLARGSESTSSGP